MSLPGGFYNANGGVCNTTTGKNCKNVQIIPNVNFTSFEGAMVPYSTALARIGYRWKPGMDLGLSATYYGSNNSYLRSAFVEFDAGGSYALTRNVPIPNPPRRRSSSGQRRRRDR